MGNFEFSLADVLNDILKIQNEPLAPFVDRAWLASRLDRAPKEKAIRDYSQRKRPINLSQTAVQALLDCGFFHEKSLRLLRQSIKNSGSETTIDHHVVKSAFFHIGKAVEKFAKIRSNDDFKLCLGDFESLMNTVCLFLTMHSSTVDWATLCMDKMKKQRPSLVNVQPVPVKEDFSDADMVLKMVVDSCQKAMNLVEMNKKLGKRQPLRRTKMATGAVKPKAKAPSEEIMPTGHSELMAPCTHSTPEQTLYTATAFGNLGSAIYNTSSYLPMATGAPTPPVISPLHSTSTAASSPIRSVSPSYEFSYSSPSTSPDMHTTSLAPMRHSSTTSSTATIGKKRALSSEEDAPDSLRSQRRMRLSSTPSPTPCVQLPSFTYNPPVTTSELIYTPELLSTPPLLHQAPLPAYDPLLTFAGFSWDPNEAVDLTPVDGFKVMDVVQMLSKNYLYSFEN
ncbi:hypothetical protein BDZ91DRAFT_37623 [Kalaharituber pfeilii]|nr:hypothetical protein BDZ91DRAFT_37623 [Kalaharituber pfeilii]